MIFCRRESSAPGAAMYSRPKVCRSVWGCAWVSGMPAASMIGRTILITAVVDSCPPASGKLPSRAAAELGKQQRVAGELGDSFAGVAPLVEGGGDVGVERDRSDLVSLAVHAEIHRPAVVV